MSQYHQLTKEQPESVKKLNLPGNTSVVLLKKQTIEVRDEPLPILQPDGVLVKVISTDKSSLFLQTIWKLTVVRICGSDMHGYLSGGVGGRPVVEPLVMGHESAGEVIAVGEYVKTHKIGDRVAVEPGLPCRRCINCKNGRGNICQDVRYCGAPGSVGSLARFHALPADMAPHLPDHLSWEEAGSIQPLAIGVQIGKRACLAAHQTLAIFGCGPIGLITAAVAHAYSARKIIGIDNSPFRVDFAKKYISPLTGKPIFDAVYLNTDLPTDSLKHPTKSATPHVGTDTEVGDATAENDDDHETVGDIKWEHAKLRVQGWVKELGLEDEEGVDRVVEASGAEDCMLLGIAFAKQGGTFLQVGLNHVQTSVFPNIAVTNKELDVKGITRYTASCFPSAIDMLNRGVVDLKPLITITYPMTKAKEALEAVRSGKQIKVIIKNQE